MDIMSGIYRQFITLLLFVAITAVITIIFYPLQTSRPNHSTGLPNFVIQKPRVVSSERGKSSFSIRTPTRTASATEPKYVVIVTYQRCGSSFFGNVFNLNPEAFYAYEPLDSLYSAMYGTTPGWNVPSDITNNADGTARDVPELEINAVANFLFTLLTGEDEQLPTATLVHKFWTSFSQWHKESSNFTACLKQNGLTRVKCYLLTHRYCGMRFRQKPAERTAQCYQLIANKSFISAGLDPKIVRIFKGYHSCLESFRKRVDKNCSKHLRQAISGNRIRATKVVRATMDSMRPLLLALPNLRVIHLVRDPQAVALSRNRFSPSALGAYTQSVPKKSGSRIVTEATLYCHHVTRDIRSRLKLEREFPGRIKMMTYEDVMANPDKKFREIYELLNEPAPKSIIKAMNKQASKGQKQNLTTKWQNVLSVEDTRKIANICSEFFRLVNHHS